ncbi:IPT/TIG domain-containing protein [Paenibacillus agilis]|uniref:VWA domain-containing protein n=1 Tax=Paenibacillus agilis TaxID=3020863 RepID=A0A559IP62_9BACL|nr:IPT/TIG domain-containing protein [Paenibacillus agilis]TVX89444.1 VWA domain-containing protein [Paenibacillus agilis]
MRLFRSRLLAMLLVFVLAFTSLPLATISAATGTHTVSVNKSAPAQLKEGGEAEVTLQVKGSPPVGFVKPNDVILVIDRSGSMGASHPENNGEDKMKNAKEAAQHFVNMLDQTKMLDPTKHQVGIVDYSASASTKPLSTNAQEINAYIETLTAGGGTATHDAIAKARAELNNRRSGAQPVIVLMTDGAANSFPDALREAQAAKNEGIVFYTVGLLTQGGRDNESIKQLMRNMATTEKHHYIEYSSDKLKQVYETISKEIGIASAYNVVIEDVLSPEFEIVPGSYEHNIPAPVVAGNKVTWKFNELKEELLTLTFKVKHKQNGSIGKVSLGEGPIQVSYKNHLDQQQSFQVNQPTVDVSLHGPEVTSIEPNLGASKGGETITINGKNFKATSTVSFGNNVVANVEFVSSEKLVVTAPAGQAGKVNVTVTNPDAQKAVVSQGYEYLHPVPVLTSITPNKGDMAGQYYVTLAGENFHSGSVVSINNVPARTVFISSKELRALVPASTVHGPVAVKIVNGTLSEVSAEGAFTYNAPPVPEKLELMNITPDNGAMAGNYYITLTGKGFTKDSKVSINNTEVRTIFVSATELSALVPAAQKAGAVDVKVSNGANNEAVKVGGFTYNAPPEQKTPTITSITPDNGAMTGNYQITIAGTEFHNKAVVHIGGTPVTTQFVSATELKAIVPATNKPGAVDVKVVNSTGYEVVKANGFTYNAPPVVNPTITSITPNNGALSGNYYITIKGTEFDKDTKVSIGGVEARTVYVSATELSVLVPVAQKAGAVDVKAVNSTKGEVVVAGGFTYNAPPEQKAPTITSITPDNGAMAGNYQITIAGTEFHNKSVVHIGGTPVATEFVSATELKALVPATNKAGAVAVKVVNGPGFEAVKDNGFTYNAPPVVNPTITSITPNNGALSGNYYITIKGTEFDKDTKVSIGGVEARTVYVSATELSALVPAAQKAGAVDVKVVNGTKGEAVAAGGFTYNAPPEQKAPTIISITPDNGEMAGNYQITIVGTDFYSKSVVHIGGTAVATQFVSATELKGLVPATKTPGPVAVKVVNGAGFEAAVDNGFTYNAPPVITPTITSISPDNGVMAGNYYITINGTEFDKATKVSIGGVEVRTVYHSATKLEALVPVTQTAGAVEVKVVNGTKGEAIKVDGFTYNAPPEEQAPTITSVSPDTGALAGNYYITITGTGFTKQSKASINGVEVRTVYYSATRVDALVPTAQTPGTVEVKVANGTKAGVKADGFTYIAPPTQTAPTITSITPDNGAMAGNYQITIAGTEFHNKSVVHIGGTPVATEFVSATELKGLVPATKTPGPVTVKVVNGTGFEAVVDNGFTYNAPPVVNPTITSITPDNGALSGNYYITINGTEFDRETKVSIGGVEVRTVYFSATRVDVLVPAAQTAGTVEVKVVNGTKGEAVKSDGFTYKSSGGQQGQAPTVTSISPNSGKTSGNYYITINGTGFNKATKVSINGVEVRTVYFSATRVDVLVPRTQVAGAVDVKVVNGSGEVVVTGGFTYL